MRLLSLLLIIIPVVLLGGCGSQQRTITVTSEPPGALCYLNDVEIGRTPCDTEFKFFGIYDVRLIAEGYEPFQTSEDTPQPFTEFPGIDLIAAALPGHRVTDFRWHYVLTPKPPAPDRAARAGQETDLVGRAQAMRSDASAPTPTSTPTSTAVPETPATGGNGQ